MFSEREGTALPPGKSLKFYDLLIDPHYPSNKLPTLKFLLRILHMSKYLMF
jgi:hypothetical protein